MIIGFTGHRNKVCNPADLESIATAYPDAFWVHGGAMGFDAQVEEFAVVHYIRTRVIRPDYDQWARIAPLVRNRQIVDGCGLLVACYDGREFGGTYYTIQYARSKGHEVRIIQPVDIVKIKED